MRIGIGAAIVLTGAAPPPGPPTAPAPQSGPAERVVEGDALVPVSVNGRPLRLRIEPGAPGLPLVAPALAPALGLKKPGFFGMGVEYAIGPEKLFGATQVVPFGLGSGAPDKRRVGWMSRDYSPMAGDGSLGPAGLPEPVVRFVLHAPCAGERSMVLPTVGGTGLFGQWFAIDAAVRVGDTPVRLRFDPHHARTLANASAAVAIAATHGGVMSAETGRQEIAFGVERPFRVMKLARPLMVGGAALDRIGVRVTDGDIAGRIAEEGAAPEAADPDEVPGEVVVTARRGKHGKPAFAMLRIGADVLAACSSIVFDKPARQVRIACGGA